MDAYKLDEICRDFRDYTEAHFDDYKTAEIYFALEFGQELQRR